MAAVNPFDTRPADGSTPLAALLAAALLLAAAPRPAAADESGVVLGRGSLAAVVADLDGDGAREIVVLRGGPQDPEARSEYLLEAWGVRDGSWASLGTMPFLRWDGGDEPVTRPARVGTDAVGLLAVSRGGERGVLAISSVDDDHATSGGCCLSLGWVRLEHGRLILELQAADLGRAESVAAVDLDADGTDELFVTEGTLYSDVGPSLSTYRVLRLTEDGYVPDPFELPETPGLYHAASGESDGLAGDDLLFIETEAAALQRVTDDRGTLRVERVEAVGIADWQFGAWIAGAVNGRILLVEERSVSMLRWPRGRVLEQLAEVPAPAFSAMLLLGSGPHARIVELAGTGPTSEPLGLRVYDLDLVLERYLPAPQLVNEVWRFATAASSGPVESIGYVYPQIGMLPGGIDDDRPALIGYGSLLVIEADGSLRVVDTLPLVGRQPLGLAGPDDAWLVSGPPWSSGGSSAYLSVDTFEPPMTNLAVVPLTSVLDPASAHAAISVIGAAEVGGGVDRRLVAPEGGFEVSVTGMPDGVVITSAGTRVGSAVISDGPVRLRIDPGGQRSQNQRFEAAVIVIGPSGIATGMRWDAEILREPPEVTVHTSHQAFSMRATVFGRASAAATVSVDGQPVATNLNGAFRVEVDAPIWPRDVEVVARDPLGNEVVELVAIIGFVDYRGLPWIPIMAVLTVATGIVLFLRTPRLRPQQELVTDGDGLLEEIDGDRV